jgi:hypothetical protein
VSTYIFYVIFILIVGLAIWVSVGSKKRRWYLVYLANNDVLLLNRDLNERWWRSNGTYLRFKNELGDEVTFLSQGHWIIKMVSVPDNQLEIAREQVKKIKENQAKAEA